MPEKNMSFEESMKQLEQIVAELEKNEKPLDETIRLFEEGLHLSKKCNDQLRAFEEKVNELVRGNSNDSL